MDGLGVMIQNLYGGGRPASDYYGLEITAAVFADDKLSLSFANGKNIAIADEGQSCCESRYMTCDDNVGTLVGGKLVSIEARDGDGVEDKYGEHETIFVVVQTDSASVTVCTHNKHNGYYGGFALRITEQTHPLPPGRGMEGE